MFNLATSLHLTKNLLKRRKRIYYSGHIPSSLPEQSKYSPASPHSQR